MVREDPFKSSDESVRSFQPPSTIAKPVFHGPMNRGEFPVCPDLRAWIGSSSETDWHDVTDEIAAYRLADQPFPGLFGVFLESDRPTKNSFERNWIDTTRARMGNPSDLQLLERTFARMK